MFLNLAFWSKTLIKRKHSCREISSICDYVYSYTTFSLSRVRQTIKTYYRFLPVTIAHLHLLCLTGAESYATCLERGAEHEFTEHTRAYTHIHTPTQKTHTYTANGYWQI